MAPFFGWNGPKVKWRVSELLTFGLGLCKLALKICVCSKISLKFAF